MVAFNLSDYYQFSFVEFCCGLFLSVVFLDVFFLQHQKGDALYHVSDVTNQCLEQIIGQIRKLGMNNFP